MSFLYINELYILIVIMCLCLPLRSCKIAKLQNSTSNTMLEGKLIDITKQVEVVLSCFDYQSHIKTRERRLSPSLGRFYRLLFPSLDSLVGSCFCNSSIVDSLSNKRPKVSN